MSPKHDDEKWLALPEEVRVVSLPDPLILLYQMLTLVKKSTTIHHPFILSDLKAVALRLLDDILGNRLIGAQSPPYQAAIEAHGSANAVVDMLFATIRPEIIELQGKIVSTATLTCIKSRQSKDSHWSSPVGYASFVTDARNSKYV
ncbi:hypothetical protein V8C43DRAFT_306084 [Trichoderma afarasin]